MPAVFSPLLLHNGSSQRHVPVSVIGMGRKLYGSVWVSWPVHCAIGSSPGWFHSLGTCGPDTGSGVLATGRRWRGPFAARRRAGAWSAKQAAGGRPGREEGARDGPARPG